MSRSIGSAPPPKYFLKWQERNLFGLSCNRMNHCGGVLAGDLKINRSAMVYHFSFGTIDTVKCVNMTDRFDLHAQELTNERTLEWNQLNSLRTRLGNMRSVHVNCQRKHHFVTVCMLLCIHRLLSMHVTLWCIRRKSQVTEAVMSILMAYEVSSRMFWNVPFMNCHSHNSVV